MLPKIILQAFHTHCAASARERINSTLPMEKRHEQPQSPGWHDLCQDPQTVLWNQMLQGTKISAGYLCQLSANVPTVPTICCELTEMSSLMSTGGNLWYRNQGLMLFHEQPRALYLYQYNQLHSVQSQKIPNILRMFFLKKKKEFHSTDLI